MPNPLIQMVAWIRRHKQRIGLIAIGHTTKHIEEILVDWLVYGAVVLWATNTWGPVYGSLVAFAIMTPLTAILCLLYFRFYDWAQVDWFGFELIKEWRDEEKHDGWVGRFMHRVTRMGGIPAFLALSIYTDAFMTTVYLRKKHVQYGGLVGRDWLIFWGSLLLSNGFWVIGWSTFVFLAKVLWQWIQAM